MPEIQDEEWLRRYDKMLRDHAALDARIDEMQRDQMRYEQRMSLASAQMQFQAERVTHVMALGMNPRISDAEFERLANMILAPQPIDLPAIARDTPLDPVSKNAPYRGSFQ